MKYLEWFHSLLLDFKKHPAQFKNLSEITSLDSYPCCEIIQKEVNGRSGNLAWQN